MKRLAITIIAILTATAAYSACRTHTYFINGRTIVCTICCDNNHNCTETCS